MTRKQEITHLHTYYPTVALSDIHLGTQHSKTEEVIHFLKSINCDRLILDGDITDGWHLQESGLGKWKAKHTDFFKMIMKMMENFGTQVIYVRGNYDDFLGNLASLDSYNAQIVENCIHESHGERYYVVHGDIFDTVIIRMKWLAKLGDTRCVFLLWLNKVYNARRMKQGKPCYSLSRSIKGKVKTAVSYISDLERELMGLAKVKECDGVICKHIHHPANTYCDGIHHLSSSDWAEILSALTGDEEGNWTICYFDNELLKENNNKEKKTTPIIKVS